LYASGTTKSLFGRNDDPHDDAMVLQNTMFIHPTLAEGPFLA
jgi:hypothetical protein